MNSILDWLLNVQKPFAKRIFISFSVEDARYRDYLVQQTKDQNSSFYFHDWSVKAPWYQSEWKRKCRIKINRCCGMIVLLGDDTHLSTGVHFEANTARDYGIPIMALRIRKNSKISKPKCIMANEIYIWSWKNISFFLNKI